MRGMLSSTVRICEVMGRSKGCPFFMRSPGNEIDLAVDFIPAHGRNHLSASGSQHQQVNGDQVRRVLIGAAYVSHQLAKLIITQHTVAGFFAPDVLSLQPGHWVNGDDFALVGTNRKRFAGWRTHGGLSW